MIFNENFPCQLAGSECRFFGYGPKWLVSRNHLSKWPACKLDLLILCPAKMHSLQIYTLHVLPRCAVIVWFILCRTTVVTATVYPLNFHGGRLNVEKRPSYVFRVPILFYFILFVWVYLFLIRVPADLSINLQDPHHTWNVPCILLLVYCISLLSRSEGSPGGMWATEQPDGCPLVYLTLPLARRHDVRFDAPTHLNSELIYSITKSQISFIVPSVNFVCFIRLIACSVFKCCWQKGIVAWQKTYL